MPHDPHLVKRNLLVIPGGLLAFYSLVVILYAEGIRSASATDCAAAGQVMVQGVCYVAWKWALALAALGAVLVALGLTAVPRRPATVEGILYPGTGIHFTGWLLGSWVGATLAALLVYGSSQRADDVVYTLTIRGTDYQFVLLLEMLLAVTLLAFVPFMGLALHQRRMRRRLMRLLEEEAPAAAPEAEGEPLGAVQGAPLRDVGGREGVYINLDDERPGSPPP